MPADFSLATLTAYPAWLPFHYFFDFAPFPQIQAGQTIASVVRVTNLSGGALAVGAGAISGSKVTFPASGGVAGQTYLLECVVTFSGGDVGSWRGNLYFSN